MKKNKILYILITIFLLSAFLIMLDQWIKWQHLWDIEQSLHHETFALIFIAIAIGIVISISIKKRK